MKIGKRCRQTAEEVLNQLTTVDVLNFEVNDRTNIHKAVGPWLMENCERLPT